MAGPGPLFQIVVNRIREITRAHAELLQFGDNILALFASAGGVIRIRVPVDAERNAESLAFGDVALSFAVDVVAGAESQADDRTFHAVGFCFAPVDVSLPYGNVNHAFGLLHE